MKKLLLSTAILLLATPTFAGHDGEGEGRLTFSNASFSNTIKTVYSSGNFWAEAKDEEGRKFQIRFYGYLRYSLDQTTVRLSKSWLGRQIRFSNFL